MKDGKEALKLLEEGPPIDLLFTDVVLPGGLGGEKIAEKVKQMQPGIKILYTTGYGESSVIFDGKLSRDSIVIKKPFLRVELLEKVRELLDNRQD